MIAPASRRIGKYEIVRKLGRGGMADVYLAHDSENGDTVALKLIEHATDADTIAAIEAERRGAELQANLAAIDPRVVRVYGAGDVDGFFYVVMEYIEGQDLAELMRRGPLVVGFATEVAIAVAKTLDNAHNLEIAIDGKDFRGVVHGDIKPKNIRIDTRGEVRVLDFGIAKALSMSRRLTRNEFGSVPYASPERLDSGDVNVGSDLWSLGVMLYEMVTGLQPYQAGNTEWLERMIRSRIAPPPAPKTRPGAGEEEDDLLAQRILETRTVGWQNEHRPPRAVPDQTNARPNIERVGHAIAAFRQEYDALAGLLMDTIDRFLQQRGSISRTRTGDIYRLGIFQALGVIRGRPRRQCRPWQA